DVRDEISASRTSGLFALVCRLFVVYGPGTLMERELGLKHISDPPAGTTVQDTIDILRRWSRWCSRMVELGGVLPDSAIQVRALTKATKAVVSQNPEMAFRINLARAALQVDMTPDDDKVKKLHAQMLSELEAACGSKNHKQVDCKDASSQQIKSMLADAARFLQQAVPPPPPGVVTQDKLRALVKDCEEQQALQLISELEEALQAFIKTRTRREVKALLAEDIPGGTLDDGKAVLRDLPLKRERGMPLIHADVLEKGGKGWDLTKARGYVPLVFGFGGEGVRFLEELGVRGEDRELDRRITQARTQRDSPPGVVSSEGSIKEEEAEALLRAFEAESVVSSDDEGDPLENVEGSEAQVQRVNDPSPAEVERWKAHLQNGHVPYRRDCRQCIEGAGVGVQHRRVRHPQSYALSADLFGPVPSAEHGRDETCVSGRRNLKYALVGAFRIPRSAVEGDTKEAGVEDLFESAGSADPLEDVGSEYAPSEPPPEVLDDLEDLSAPPRVPGTRVEPEASQEELLRELFEVPDADSCARAPYPFSVEAVQGTSQEEQSILVEGDVPQDPQALRELIKDLKVAEGIQKMILSINARYPVRWVEARYAAPHSTIPDGHVLITDSGNLVASKEDQSGSLDQEELEQLEAENGEGPSPLLPGASPDRRLRVKTSIRFVECDVSTDSESFARECILCDDYSRESFRMLVGMLPEKLFHSKLADDDWNELQRLEFLTPMNLRTQTLLTESRDPWRMTYNQFAEHEWKRLTFMGVNEPEDLAYLFEEDLIEIGISPLTEEQGHRRVDPLRVPEETPQADPTESPMSQVPQTAASSSHEPLRRPHQSELYEEDHLEMMYLQSMWEAEEDTPVDSWPPAASSTDCTGLGMQGVQADNQTAETLVESEVDDLCVPEETQADPTESPTSQVVNKYECRALRYGGSQDESYNAQAIGPRGERRVLPDSAQVTGQSAMTVRIGVPTGNPLSSMYGVPQVASPPRVRRVDEAMFTPDVEGLLERLEGPLEVVHNVAPAEVRSHLEKWRQAATTEVQSLETMGAIRRLRGQEARGILRSGDVEIIPAKAVCTVKPGSPFKRKVRVVSCGNFASTTEETLLYAGGAGAETLRALLVHNGRRGRRCHSLDVKSAFLLAPIPAYVKKRYAVRPPKLLTELGICAADEIWMIERALYGFRESPRWWSVHRDSVLSTATWNTERGALRLRQLASDSNVWSIELESGECMGHLLIYVDDMLIMADDCIAASFFEWIRGRWDCTDLETASCDKPLRFLGVDIYEERDEHDHRV
ncbi:GIP, partial [Symbiodinium sp. CCMP2456]